MSLDLEKQLCFYGAYHHNSTNVGIHIICVPLILAAAILLSTNSPVLIPLPDWLAIPYFPLNLAALVAFVYSGFYILLEPVVGTVLLPVIFGWTAYANHLTSVYPYNANVAGVVVEVVAWIAQFIGHGVFEGRAPALLDNLLQSLVLAPFFVFMEVLFYFGYRPELNKRVQAGVQKEIRKFHAEKAAAAAAKDKSK